MRDLNATWAACFFLEIGSNTHLFTIPTCLSYKYTYVTFFKIQISILYGLYIFYFIFFFSINFWLFAYKNNLWGSENLWVEILNG